ncbi:3-dehydroquinate dehydratase [Lachnospiraceae bacterium XBB1006]|nr:3-dehydroquinate dehydratase [Lachnospiraceae bacterium XBB1006]
MTNVVTLRTVEIGAGRPKIAVSIAGQEIEQVRQELQRVLTEGRSETGWDIDLIEIRMDMFSSVTQRETVRLLLDVLRKDNPSLPFLFTYRSKQEGGKGTLSEDAYGQLLLWAAESGAVDAIDVEGLHYQENAPGWIAQIHERGVYVVVSYHDAKKTPENMDVILQRLSACGGDIVKLAVMANSTEDACRLAVASRKFTEQFCQPIISMAMGEMGRTTRICLEKTGSSVTFGAIGTPSAPGQIPVKELVPWIK